MDSRVEAHQQLCHWNRDPQTTEFNEFCDISRSFHHGGCMQTFGHPPAVQRIVCVCQQWPEGGRGRAKGHGDAMQTRGRYGVPDQVNRGLSKGSEGEGETGQGEAGQGERCEM